MADLSDTNAAQTVKVVGADSTGVEQTPVQSTTNGAIHTNLRNTAGTEAGTSTTPLRIDPTGTTVQPVSNTSAGGIIAAVNQFNRLQVNLEPSDLLSDKFDSALDTVKWTSTIVGTATNLTSAGNLTQTGGTTTGNAAVISSVPLFTQKANVQISYANNIKFESTPLITGAHRFWGLGTAGNNTVANPLTDAIGFEIDSTGVLNACVYQGGTRIFSQALTIPSDGLNHRYTFIWRTDKVAFYLDGSDSPNAVANGKIPNTQILPARSHVLVSTATTSPSIIATAIGIGDTGRNSVAISDGVYGFRKATVNADGSFNVAGTLLTSLDNKHPTINLATYSAASLFVPTATTATDVLTFTGSATKTIRIHKIKITMTTTSGTAIKTPFQLVRRLTANTGGTSTTVTAVSHDSVDTAATAVISTYTVNPTALGTQVGLVRAEQNSVSVSGVNGGTLEWVFDGPIFKQLILRGTSQSIAINLNGTSVTGPVMGVSIEWSEE